MVMGVAQSVDPATRTVRVRILVPDKERRFHPEMFFYALIKADLGVQLAVPEEAVMNSGTRTIVYVIKDNQTFEPREVKLAAHANGYYQVISGLSEGEDVVVSGNFSLIQRAGCRG